MEIAELFTKKNLEILNLLKVGRMHIRDIASRLDCSPAKVHDSLQLFKKYELVEERQDKNKIMIVLNKKNPLLIKIQALLDESIVPDEYIKLFDCISPLDYRYYGRKESVFKKLQPYLSEEALIKYQLKVEAALTKVLANRGMCSKEIADEVANACKKVRAQEVYREEDRIKHNIRAMVNCIREKVSDKAKPYVHFTTTSHDIICTADAARYKEVGLKVVVPTLIEFEKTLIALAEREKDTIQIGRTHGQHAEPITFGFTIAEYVSRIGNRIVAIEKTAKDLRGKLAGAVGAYNASSLFFDDPEEFEKEILAELNLKPSTHSTQVVEPEYTTDFINAIVSCFGVLANLADDMRHLQRSELNEVAESFGKKQVGSSTMPHKRNPINFENVKSMWKEFMPRMNTVYMDQICEHQRDLTNSASSRFIPEIIAALVSSVERLNKVMSNLVVDKKSLEKNFNLNKDMIAAEPAYILLAAHNHPDAHEIVREITLESQKSGKKFVDLFFAESSLKEYISKFNKKQIEILKNPEKYTGVSGSKALDVCSIWKQKLGL